MEPSAFHITNPAAESSRTAPPDRSPPAAEPRRRDTPVRLRLGLQQRGQINVRRHLTRSVRRFSVLLVADLGSFYVMRALLRAVRDDGILGGRIAGALNYVLPKGILNGWQFAAALVVGLLVMGNYGPGDLRRNPRRLFLACALATALPLWMTIWTRGLELVAVQYVLTTTLVWLGLMVDRLTLDQVVARVLPADRTAAPTLFVGPAEECREGMKSPAFGSPTEHRVLGFVDVHIPPAADALGHIVDFAQVLHDSRAETIVVCGYLTDGRFHDVVDAALAAGCQVLSVPRAIEIAGVQPLLVWRRDQPLVELTAPSLKGWQLFVKRLVDLVGAAVGLAVASPVMALCAVLIKLDSPGPVFFRQERIGSAGRRFNVWKFRTMRDGVSHDAHRQLVQRMLKSDEPGVGQQNGKGERVFKLVNDERVTKLGRLLRRTSLDELPQLFNVLRGDMSLVGPRPPLDYEFAAYDQWQFDRHQVKPGITGLWQVSGRNLLTYRQMCELDVQYVRNWSLWLDLKLMLRTIPVVLFNSGRAA